MNEKKQNPVSLSEITWEAFWHTQSDELEDLVAVLVGERLQAEFPYLQEGDVVGLSAVLVCEFGHEALTAKKTPNPKTFDVFYQDYFAFRTPEEIISIKKSEKVFPEPIPGKEPISKTSQAESDLARISPVLSKDQQEIFLDYPETFEKTIPVLACNFDLMQKDSSGEKVYFRYVREGEDYFLTGLRNGMMEVLRKEGERFLPERVSSETFLSSEDITMDFHFVPGKIDRAAVLAVNMEEAIPEPVRVNETKAIPEKDSLESQKTVKPEEAVVDISALVKEKERIQKVLSTPGLVPFILTKAETEVSALEETIRKTMEMEQENENLDLSNDNGLENIFQR